MFDAAVYPLPKGRGLSGRHLIKREDPAHFVRVARKENRVLGVIWAKVKPDDWLDCQVGHINFIGVDPTTQNQGVGTLLMEAAEAWFQTQEIQGKTLNVASNNPYAIQLYQSFGYTTVGYLMHAPKE